MTNQTRENIKQTHILGLRGILKISDFKSTIYKDIGSIICLIISVFIILSAAITQVDIYNLIIEIKNTIISFLPGILGFTLAGYTLVIGFIQTNMLERISEKLENSDYSLYQKMSSIFCLNVILQGFALIIAYVIHFIIYFDNNSIFKLHLPDCLISTINWIALLILSLSLTFGLILVLQIVINVFNFSQLHHYLINKSKVEEKEKEQSKDSQ